MHIETEQQAFFIACEMESTAVQLYERAMSVLRSQGREKERLYCHLASMRMDEAKHLKRFRMFYSGLDTTVEQSLTLSAVAEGILFEGGLIGAARQGLLDDVPSMLRFATNAESASAKKYREFAALTRSAEASAALIKIAEEEERHLADLQAQAAGEGGMNPQ